MIKRIVKMSFHPENIQEFIKVYESNWSLIRGFEGCEHVELLQGETEQNIFFTYSMWQSEEHLNAYRSSELFGRVWSSTKKLFNDKPQAWSVRQLTF